MEEELQYTLKAGKHKSNSASAVQIKVDRISLSMNYFGINFLKPIVTSIRVINKKFPFVLLNRLEIKEIY